MGRSLRRTWEHRLDALATEIARGNARAEDATQEALVAAWRQLSALRDPDRFDAWLRRLLIRACYREADKEQRQRRITTRIEPFATAGPDPGIAIADQDELERGFATLRPDQRALVVLHYYLGLTVEEAATTIGIPVGTAKSRLHYATEALRAALEADARGVSAGGASA